MVCFTNHIYFQHLHVKRELWNKRQTFCYCPLFWKCFIKRDSRLYQLDTIIYYYTRNKTRIDSSNDLFILNYVIVSSKTRRRSNYKPIERQFKFYFTFTFYTFHRFSKITGKPFNGLNIRSIMGLTSSSDSIDLILKFFKTCAKIVFSSYIANFCPAKSLL